MLLVAHGNANKLGNKNASEYTTNDKFAVLTGTIDLTNGVGSATFDYPEGFNMNNCVPVAGGTKYSGMNRYAFGIAQNSIMTGVYLQTNVALVVYPINEGGPTGSFDCKLVLMKIS